VKFLANVTMDYAIVGGKAAIYHLAQEPYASRKKDNLQLESYANHSDDWDILIREKDEHSFVDALQEAIRSALGPYRMNLVTFEREILNGETLYLMGYMKSHSNTKGERWEMFEDLIGLHVIPTGKPFPKSQTDKTLNLRYAPVKWICQDLKEAIENNASSEVASKTYKRMARQQLLNCEKI